MTIYREDFALDEVGLIVDGTDVPAQIHGLSADLVWDDHLEHWFVDRLYAGSKRIDDVAALRGLVESAQAYVARSAIQTVITAAPGVKPKHRDPHAGCRLAVV